MTVTGRWVALWQVAACRSALRSREGHDEVVMKLYDKLLEVLRAHDVRSVYGVPGDAINPFIEALRTDQDVQYVHVVHEESAAFAASAAAKLTGRLQVCAGTVGPGAIHLLNGLYDAKKDHAPVLAILGQVPTEFLGGDYHQEVDLSALFGDVTGYLAEIRNPAQMPHVAIEACNAALATGRPSALVIPHDLGSRSVSDGAITVFSPEDAGTIVPPQACLETLGARVRGARRIALFIGEGARSGAQHLLPLARHLCAPIIHTLRAKDLVPHDSEWSAGGIGLLGGRGGVKAMADCDLLLVFGCDFPYRDWYDDGCDVVQIDTRAEVLGRRRPGALGVHGDAATVMRWLLEEVEPRGDDGLLGSVQAARRAWDAELARQESLDGPAGLIHPQAVARILSNLAQDDAIFTCDTGEVTVWGARHLHLRSAQRFTCSFNLASMAYAMPAALGAQVSYPGRQVISLSGDGGFNMLMGDLLTAVKYALPIRVVIFNNHKLGLIKMEQEVEGYPESETDLCNPDYAALAKAMGAAGFSVSEPAELEATIAEALSVDGPSLVDVQVNPNELTMPPKIHASQALGFGLAKLRELINI